MKRYGGTGFQPVLRNFSEQGGEFGFGQLSSLFFLL
jgi:hypothetical protein